MLLFNSERDGTAVRVHDTRARLEALMECSLTVDTNAEGSG